jgi:hypothetical protein
MKLLDTERRKAGLLFRKSVEDFMTMEDPGDPDWHGDLRCDWLEFSARMNNDDTVGGWLMRIDGVRIFWCHPIDVSNPGMAVAEITSLLCRFLKADAVARRLLGP